MSSTTTNNIAATGAAKDGNPKEDLDNGGNNLPNKSHRVMKSSELVLADTNLLHHIFGFILDLASEEAVAPVDPLRKRHLRVEVLSNFASLRGVNKLFHDVAWEVCVCVSKAMASNKHREYPADIIVSVQDLAAIKSRVIGLDLSGLFEEVLRNCPDRSIVTQMRIQRRANSYKKFLIIKAIEHLANKKIIEGNISGTPSSTLILNVWKERCRGRLYTYAFWHAHVSSPDNYAKDCNYILSGKTTLDKSNIIHRNFGFLEKCAGSGYVRKHSTLFYFFF